MRLSLLNFSPAICAALLLTGAPAQTDDGIRHGFVDNRFGQLHYRVREAREATSDRVPLVLFHSSPLSGAVYRDLMIAFDDRTVLAVDTPGFGLSSRTAKAPSMAELAAGIADGLAQLALDGGRGYDLFGRLTGSIVALELAAQRPALVRNLVIGAVPYFTGESQADMYEEYAVGYNQPVPEDGSHLQRYWQSIVTERDDTTSLEDATDVFLDLIRAKPVHWWGYHAVFTHDTKARAENLTVPVTILDYENPFREQEGFLARILPAVNVLPLPDHDRSLSGAGATRLAATLRKALD